MTSVPVREFSIATFSVLVELGFDLFLQVEAGHLSQPKKIDGDVRQFFPGTLLPFAPGVERLRNFPVKQAEL